MIVLIFYHQHCLCVVAKQQNVFCFHLGAFSDVLEWNKINVYLDGIYSKVYCPSLGGK